MMLKATLILLFVGFAAPDAISSVVSRILSLAKESKSRSPVILLVNSRALDQSSVEVNRQSSDESESSLINLLSQINKPRTNPQKRYPIRPDRDNVYDYVRSKPKTEVNIPIYKTLLSLRNSLRCGARDECKDECSDTYVGNKKKKCKMTCEIEYECDDEKPKCGKNDGCNVSTRGPMEPIEEEDYYGCSTCREKP